MAYKALLLLCASLTTILDALVACHLHLLSHVHLLGSEADPQDFRPQDDWRNQRPVAGGFAPTVDEAKVRKLERTYQSFNERM